MRHRNGCSMLRFLWFTIVSLTIVSGHYFSSQLPGSPNDLRTLLNPSLQKGNSSSHDDLKNIPNLQDDEYRLPMSLKPLHYVVRLQPFLHGNFSIPGHVDIEMEVLEATSTVTIHVNDIVTFDETLKIALSDDVGGPGIGINGTTIDEVHDYYIVSLEEELEQGKNYILSLDFEGYLNTEGIGFYRESYVDEEGNTVYVALTQFEAVGARRAFPCFDEPSLKATFEVYLGREDSVSALCNMPLAETIPIEDQEGWYWDHYETSVIMPTYLVAFVISDFASNNTLTVEGLPYAAWTRRQEIEHAQYALDKGPDVLTFFGEYLGVPYVLPKMDIVASLEFGGAMENWGLIIFSEDAMLFDPDVQTEAEKQHLMRTIAHETSHQWFGDLVTMGWWSHLWLNEGFAKYMEYIGANHTEPSWNIADQFVVNELQYVLEIDSDETTSHSLIKNVSSPAEIDTIVDSITYQKGGSLNRMMNHFLTEETFVRGLNTYLMEYQYSNAFQDYLFSHLTTSGHEDGTLAADMTMKQIMDTWTLQAGYPVITVNRSDDGTTAIVSQKRFWISHEETGETWWVPLSYTTEENPNFENTRPKVWMSDSETEITLESLPSEDQWVIFNIQETGFYRVNYDDNNWALLQQQLEVDPEAIHPLNRAQILDDYSHLSRAGYLSYASAMNLFSYLRKETAYLPWASALNNLDYLDAMLLRTKNNRAFKNYLKDIMLPLYDAMGFEVSRNMDQQEQFLQMLALDWACDLGHDNCVENSRRLFANWMETPDDNGIIHPNLRKTVYCSSIASGGEYEWNFAWSQYLNSSTNSEKFRLLDALGCSKDTEILSRYLEMAFTEEGNIMKEDALKVFFSVTKNPTGQKLAWNFLINSVGRIMHYFDDPASLGEMVKVVCETFNTEEEKSQLLLFEKRYSQELDEVFSTLVNQVVRTVNNNIAWMERNYDVIVQWLQDHDYATTLMNM